LPVGQFAKHGRDGGLMPGRCPYAANAIGPKFSLTSLGRTTTANRLALTRPARQQADGSIRAIHVAHPELAEQPRRCSRRPQPTNSDVPHRSGAWTCSGWWPRSAPVSSRGRSAARPVRPESGTA
jgi:hypothetical protein